MEGLTINKTYADQYEKRKRSEELSKLQDKYGEISDDESSTSEEEDEEAAEDTIQKTKDFLHTLSLVKKRDPRIYDKEIEFYEESPDDKDEEDNSDTTNIHTKPMYLKDYERNRLLEKGVEAGLTDSEDEEKDESTTYVQEQMKLKESFKSAVADLIEDHEEGKGVLNLRHKTKEEKEQEEAEYVKWLKGHEAELKKEEVEDMDTLRRYWNDPNLDSDEIYLRDYILNKGWIDQDSKKLPTYDEIITDHLDISDDEEIEKQDEFERQFNFRFEEPGGGVITSYPRNVTSSVRRTDDKRKQKRKQREERKIKEKEQKREEIKRLKNLKKQEILEKLEKLKNLTGNPTVGFNELDVEGDFDPDIHDEMMKKVFNSEYYQDEEEKKPEFSDSEEEEENWDEWVPPSSREYEAPHCEDPDFNMDADFNPEETAIESTSKRKRKRRSLFSKVMDKKKPEFDPDEQTFEKYFDEYYKLDYEDIIGDLPCRFHYRSVIPNDFGLTTEEVLKCEDKELNKWITLKKAVQYRTDEEEKADIKKYSKIAQDLNKKQRILVSMHQEEEDEDEQTFKKDSKQRKRSHKEKVLEKKGSLRRGRGVGRQRGLSDSRLSSYGLSVQKIKNKRRRKVK